MTVAGIVRVVVTTALAIAVMVALYIARDALLTLYISGLLAIGLGPVVSSIEQLLSRGTQRVPRWLAILVIYLAIVGVLTIAGLLVIPPLVDHLSQRRDGGSHPTVAKNVEVPRVRPEDDRAVPIPPVHGHALVC